MSESEEDVSAASSAEDLTSTINIPLEKLSRRASSFVSQAQLAARSTLQLDVLKFQHSFGFNCQRLFNLCLIAPDVLVFASGNFIHFFSISKKSISTRRSSCGGGIGYITKNPNLFYNYLTVAENGTNPPIIIYKYPEMDVMALCEGGAERGYTYVDYSPEGETMVSQASQPDFMITLWHWKTSTVILRTRSFQNTVYRVAFSLFNPGQLITSGIGHIKFWKVCETFTGLKLVGEHGRFGKTEICDIAGSLSMPLGSALSGSEWGNILVWEEGLIKFEVCRKNRKRCHDGAITEIYLKQGEVMTVGKDGFVRIWFWETVDLADPPDDDLFVEIEPIYEYQIGSAAHQCSLNGIVKMDDFSYFWYAQDSNGGIWKADITPDNNPEPAEMLFRCHAGQVVALGMCPFSTFFATLGDDGRLHMYNYLTRKLVFFEQFQCSGCCMIWLPLSVEPSGLVLILGFSDGVVRLICVNLDEPPRTDRVVLQQTWKPHTMALTKMSINQRNTILVTAAMDKTLFIHQITQDDDGCVVIRPIGYVEIPSPATALNWKPNMFSTLLVGCLFGQVLEMDVPERTRSYTELSYKLTHIEFKEFQFESKKSALRRQIYLAALEKAKLAKVEKKRRSLERLRHDNPEIKIDEDTFLADSESDEELEPIYMPPVPNRVLWVMYSPEGSVWLSMGEYDCGYVYEFQFGKSSAMRCTPIRDAEDLEINAYLFYENLIVFGMQDGAIRVNRQKPDFRDLSDYWLLTMHDNQNGIIHALDVSYDKRFMFSVGADGNIFMYKWATPSRSTSLIYAKSANRPQTSVEDICDATALSLEQQKQKANQDRRDAIANKRKATVRQIIAKYREEFLAIMRRNAKIIASQQVQQSEIRLDERITQQIEENFQQQYDLMKRKLAYDLEKSRLLVKKVKKYFIEPLDHLVIQVFAIRKPLFVKSFRVHHLGVEFQALIDLVERMIQIEMDAQRVIKVIEDTGTEVKQRSFRRLESFLQVLTGSTIEFRLGLQCNRMLKRYRDRKTMEEENIDKWTDINARKPDPNINDPKDDAVLRAAEATIGDYKLRTDPAYVNDEDESSSTSKKFQQLIRIRQELASLRNEYNHKVFHLRHKKQILVKYIEDQRIVVERIHREIAPELRSFPFDFTANVDHLEFPERCIEHKIPVEPSRNRYIMKDEFNFVTNKFHQIVPFVFNPELYKKMLKESERSTNTMIELIDFRHQEQVFDQNRRIADIEHRIGLFDAAMEKITRSRLEVEVAAKFLDVFLLTVYQELWVLRDFKQLDDNLVESVNDQVIEQNRINMELSTLKADIERHRKNIEQGALEEKAIQQQFQAAAMGNKFWDFLRKAFKKKYRAPKVVGSDESDASSVLSDESSTEEDDDAESRDSADIGPIHMDETICPAGCDRALYDLTFALRSSRHLVEAKIRDEHTSIEQCLARIDKLQKLRKGSESKLKVRQDELHAFRQVKQKTLNEIDTIVVIRMSQMQHFQNLEEFVDIPNTLLFNNDNVANLYARVAQIEYETIQARRRHRANVVHLSRMKTDCKYMEKQIHDLEEVYEEEMIKKFGMKVNLNELEEGILRKMVFNIRANTADIQKEYAAKARELRKELAGRQDTLKCVLLKEIEKLNVLTVLQEESNLLDGLFMSQQYSKDGPDIDNAAWEDDLARLTSVANQQKLEIQAIYNEIQLLSHKDKDFEAIDKYENPEICVCPPRKPESEVSFNTHTSYPAENPRSSTIFRIINRFFDQTHSPLNASELAQLKDDVTTLFTDSATAFQDCDNADNLQAIVQQFQKLIPISILNKIAYSDIASLFQSVSIAFQNDDDPNPVEMLRCILEDTFDTLQAAPAGKSPSSQEIVEQSLKDIIMSMSLEQLLEPPVRLEVCSTISQLLGRTNSDRSSVDRTDVVNSLLEFAEENLIEADHLQLEAVVNAVLDDVVKSFEQ